MTNFKYKSVYTSVSCNKSPNILDWDCESGIVCYGASNAVVINDQFSKSGIFHKTLYHHKAQVNCVKWINHTKHMVSGSKDKTAAIWKENNGEWSVSSVLCGHSDGVTCLDAVCHDESLLVCTGSVDSSVKIWTINNDKPECSQTIQLGSGLCLAIKITILPDVKKPLLFLCLDDDKIHLFTKESSSGYYKKIASFTGHEDWVRGIDVLYTESGLLIASSSQDTFIRLWSIEQYKQETKLTRSEINIEKQTFECYNTIWSYKLDAVLSGHEGWVYSVKWHPQIQESGNRQPVYRLLSASLDKTVIIWEPNSSSTYDEDGTWTEKVRVGEVGGNGLGFYGACFGPHGTSFMANGYNGSFHLWSFRSDSNTWSPGIVCGGHFKEVVDVRWEPKHGFYLMSVSADQTTRVHAPWNNHDKNEVVWHEVARPQVHGYDMSALAIISSTKFISAAEEKISRVFEAPKNFVENFKSITGVDLLVDENYKGPEGASVPSLGLSNKAVYSDEVVINGGKNTDGDPYFVPVSMTAPPTEETLMQNTLWPEIHKLYGHGYEVFTLDASPDEKLVATACKATTAEHAAILIWDTKTWQQIQKLLSHTLTVTQLAFSPDSKHLLSVSRDRRWTIFTKDTDGLLKLSACTDKSNGVHTRIIWCCAWADENLMFATGSRDGKICVWGDSRQVNETSSLNTYKLMRKPLDITNTSVTAVTFAPVKLKDNSVMLAAGFESGYIHIYTLSDLSDDPWNLIFQLNNSVAHHLTVRRLTFRPNKKQNVLQLASCSNDRFIRIYEICY